MNGPDCSLNASLHVSAWRFSGGSATGRKQAIFRPPTGTSGEGGDMSFVTDLRYEG